MKLTYFPVRGRAEPIMYLLIDSNIEFEQETITVEEWQNLKTEGQNGPPNFPFAALPVLTFGHGARGGNVTKLGETGAILNFLERKLAPPGTTISSPPDAQARLEMVREASSFLMNRMFINASAPDWLAPPNRTTLLQSIVTPYLRSLSHHLSSSFFPPLLTNTLPIGTPGTSLTAAAATAATTIALIQAIFPYSLGPGPEGEMMRQFPRCEELRENVEGRERIKKWIETPESAGGRVKEWSPRKYINLEFIAKMADLYDKVEIVQMNSDIPVKTAPASEEEELKEAEEDTGM